MSWWKDWRDQSKHIAVIESQHAEEVAMLRQKIEDERERNREYWRDEDYWMERLGEVSRDLDKARRENEDLQEHISEQRQLLWTAEQELHELKTGKVIVSPLGNDSFGDPYEEWLRVKNTTGEDIPDGAKVWIYGAENGLPLVETREEEPMHSPTHVGKAHGVIPSEGEGYVRTWPL